MSQQSSVENVVARLRPHVRAMFWPSVGLVLIVSATVWFAGRLPRGVGERRVLALAALLALVVWLIPLLSWLAATTQSRRGE
ncbi:MAG: hypothetical protein WDM88_00080 [Galbitalea sp.]